MRRHVRTLRKSPRHKFFGYIIFASICGCFLSPAFFVDQKVQKAQKAPNVLVTHMHLPSFTRGGDQHIYSYMQGMVDLSWDVTYMYFISDSFEAHDEVTQKGIKVVGPVPAHRHFLSRILFEGNYDAAFLNYYANHELISFNFDVAEAVRKYSHKTLILPVAHDDFASRTREEGDATNADRLLRDETFIYGTGDIIVTVNDFMEVGLSKRFPNARFAPISFTYDYMYDDMYNKAAHTLRKRRRFESRRDFVFVAADNPANVQSLKFICSHLPPGLANDGFHLNVFGTVPLPEECSAGISIAHHGAVTEEEINESIRRARWFLVPCLSYVGVSTKIIRSLSQGTPVISTPLCTKHLPASQEEGFPIISVELESFVAKVMEVHDDDTTWTTLHSKSLSYYHSHFSKSELLRRLTKLEQKMELEAVKLNPAAPKTIVWDVVGDASSSFSSLNDVIASLDESEFHSQTPESCSPQNPPDVYVYWKWPVELSRPACCRRNKCTLIYILAWEFGGVPLLWLDFVNREVDIVWTLSSYNAEMFLSAGVPTRKVRIVPLSVNCEQRGGAVQPSAITSLKQKMKQKSAKRAFLYVGAALPRKGIDILLKSWCSAFPARTTGNVLIIKISYAHGGNEIFEQIDRAAADVNCAHIFIVRELIDDINSLYSVADVLVHPARSEGFGLTPLEALANGLVVLYNAAGATAEFLSPEYAVKIPSNLETCDVWPCSGDKVCVFPDRHENSWDVCEKLNQLPYWYTPRVEQLALRLKMVARNLEYFQARVRIGTRVVCEHFSVQSVSLTLAKEITFVTQSDTSRRRATKKFFVPSDSLAREISSSSWTEIDCRQARMECNTHR